MDDNPYSIAVDRSDCHWDFSNNLSLFLPEMSTFPMLSADAARRHLARANSPLWTASDIGTVTLGSET